MRSELLDRLCARAKQGFTFFAKHALHLTTPGRHHLIISTTKRQPSASCCHQEQCIARSRTSAVCTEKSARTKVGKYAICDPIITWNSPSSASEALRLAWIEANDDDVRALNWSSRSPSPMVWRQLCTLLHGTNFSSWSPGLRARPHRCASSRVPKHLRSQQQGCGKKKQGVSS